MTENTIGTDAPIEKYAAPPQRITGTAQGVDWGESVMWYQCPLRWERRNKRNFLQWWDGAEWVDVPLVEQNERAE